MAMKNAKDTEKDDEREDLDEREEETPKGEKEEEKEVSGEADEVDVSAKDDDDDAESKQERRRRRWTEMQQATKEANDRSARLEQEFQAMRQNYDAQLAAARQAQQQGPQKDELEEKIQGLQRQRISKLALIRASVGNAEAVDALAAESMQLESQIRELEFERFDRRRRSSEKPQEVNVELRMLQAEFPGVYGNANVQAYAQGEYMKLVARGKPQTIETAREANRNALRDMGMAPRHAPAPTQAQQMRHGGLPAAGGAPGPSASKVKLTGSLKRLGRARAALLTPNDDDDSAQKKFAKRLRKAGIA